MLVCSYGSVSISIGSTVAPARRGAARARQRQNGGGGRKRTIRVPVLGQRLRQRVLDLAQLLAVLQTRRLHLLEMRVAHEHRRAVVERVVEHLVLPMSDPGADPKEVVFTDVRVREHARRHDGSSACPEQDFIALVRAPCRWRWRRRRRRRQRRERRRQERFVPIRARLEGAAQYSDAQVRPAGGGGGGGGRTMLSSSRLSSHSHAKTFITLLNSWLSV